MGDPGSVPALASALWDPDPMVQHLAVMGLAWTVHQKEWAPSTELFLNDPSYLQHWRTWWLAEGKAQKWSFTGKSASPGGSGGPADWVDESRSGDTARTASPGDAGK